ncbi:hypothetical protein HDU96_009906 [Phlyctochytrium bullatum]|nr:hypothetical protein HDU96_009906 [Phlyctochytrium bullatum]
MRRLIIGLVALLYNNGEALDDNSLAETITPLFHRINEEELHVPLILEWLIPGRGKQFSEASAVEAKWDAQRLIITSVCTNIMCHVLREKQIVILLDDLQWVDVASLEVISEVAKSSSEILCLAFSRPLEDTTLKDTLVFNEHHLLRGLTKEEIAAFMLVLQCASVIGHYVDLAHLLVLLKLSDDTIDADKLRRSIQTDDKFAFLVIEEAGSDDSSFASISFRHIQIRNAIYESQALETRQYLHLKLGEHFEFGVREEEVKLYLPIACYHYSRSGNLQKKVLKNIEFGISLEEDGMWHEATAVLSDILNFIEEHYERDEIEAFLPRKLQCKAMSKLAYASALRLPFEVTSSYCIRTIELLWCPWPQNSKDFKRMLLRTLLWILKLQVKTKNGQRDVLTLKNDGLDDIRHDCIFNALSILVYVSVYDAEKQKAVLLQAMLMGYAIGLERCVSRKLNFFRAMDNFAFALQGSRGGAKIGMKFEKRARALYSSLSSDERALVATHMVASLAYLNDTVHSKRVYEDSLAFWKPRRGKLEILRLETWVSYPIFLAGEKMNDRTPHLLPLAAELGKTSPVIITTLLNVLLFESFALDALESLERVAHLYFQVVQYLEPSVKFFAGANECIPRLMLRILGSSQSRLDEEVASLADTIANASPEKNIMRTYFLSVLLTVASFSASKRSSDLSKLRKSISTCQRAFKKASHLFLGQRAYTFIAGANCHLNGNVGARAVVNWLKKTLRSRKFAGQLSEGGSLAGTGALCCAMIGLLSTSEVERKEFSAKASRMFEKSGLITLRNWALGAL